MKKITVIIPVYKVEEFLNDCVESIVNQTYKNLEIILGELKIVTSYCQRKQVNYRIVKAAIREFHFAFKDIFIQTDIESHKNEIFKELFFRFLVMFYCLQTNVLTIEEINRCMSINDLEEELSEKIKNFKEEYALWRGDLFIPAEMWFKIFNHQEINNEEIHKCILERLNPHTPSWKRLWHFKELEDDEIAQAYDGVLQDLEDKKYLHIHEILHSFMTMVILVKKGFIDSHIEKVISDAKKYMDSIEDDLQWNDVKGDIDFLWDGSGGYCYYEEKSKEFQEISQYLREKIKKRCKHNQQKVFADLLELIQQDEDAHFKISAEKYMSSDIFSANEPQLLWDTLINLPARRFGRTCYYFLEIIVSHHLLHHDEKRVLFWSKMLELANNFLREHEALKDNKAKCDYLKNEFVPQLQKMVNRDETF